MSFQLGRRQEGINGHYLLEKSSDGAEGVPEDRGEVGNGLSQLAQGEEGGLSLVRDGELENEGVYLFVKVR